MTRSVLWLVALLLASLVGCRTGVDSPPPQAAQPPLPVAELVARVRAAASADDALEVTPLRDAQTEDLRARASRLEGIGDIAGAEQALHDALQLAPGDPLLLQQAAELALLRGDWNQAITLAGRSFASGPQLGPLCRRNWTTVQVAREQFGDSGGSVAAQAQLQRCTVAAPVRM